MSHYQVCAVLFYWLYTLRIKCFAIDGNNQTILQGCSRLWFLALNSQKVVALVFMYSTMNVLTYYALARVNASIYTVLNQVVSQNCSFLSRF